MRELQKQMCDIEGLIARLVKNAYDKGYEDGMNASDKTLLPTLPYGLSYDDDIKCLELSVRAHNCLRRGGIKTIKDLTEITVADFAKVRNIGIVTVRKTIEILHEKYGIYLKGEIRDD